ncbi:HAD family hydrolase [Herbidospora sp. RD11066]
MALRAAGVEDLFAVVVQSGQVGVGKPEDVFYGMVAAAVRCSPVRVVWVGSSMLADCRGPILRGMYAALIRPFGLEPEEVSPYGAWVIAGLGDLIEDALVCG